MVSVNSYTESYLDIEENVEESGIAVSKRADDYRALILAPTVRSPPRPSASGG